MPKELIELLTYLIEYDNGDQSPFMGSGFILYGPQGNGKTVVLKKISLLFEVSYQKKSGLNAKCFKKTGYKMVRLNKLHIFFVEDLQTHFPAPQANQEQPQPGSIFNQLFPTIDGLDYNSIVIGTATSLESLDPKIRAPNRLDKHYLLDAPDEEIRLKIFRHHFSSCQSSEEGWEKTYALLATNTKGKSCAELVQIVRMANFNAHKARHDRVLIEDVPIVAPPLQPQTTPSIQTPTKEFFASRGFFGAPKALIDTVDTWRKYRATPEGEWEIPLNPGIVLYGPPGTGKTLVASLIAELLGGEYIIQNPGDLLGPWSGTAELNMNKVLQQPQKGEFRVVFMDEIDGLLSTRDDFHVSHSGAVSHFLNLIDGKTTNTPRLLLIGATNRLDSLDPAVKRPGRMGTHIKLDLPTLEVRKQILEHHFATLIFASDVKKEELLTKLVQSTTGCNCAEVVEKISEAQRRALTAGRPLQGDDFSS